MWCIAATLIVIGTVASMLVTRSFVQSDLRKSLRSHRASFEKYAEMQRALLDRTAVSVASMPQLKATLAIEGIDRETADYAADEAKRLLGLDATILLGPDERVLGSTLKGLEFGRELILTDGFLELGQRVFRTVSAPVTIGDRALGVVVIGTPVGDEFARDIARATGTQVLIVDRDRSIASSARELLAIDARSLASIADASRDEAQPVPVGRQSVLALTVSLSESIRAVLIRPLAALDNLYVRIMWLVAIGALLSGVVAIFAARIAANRISRPISELTEASKKLAQGQLDTQVRQHGPREIQILGGSFNRLALRIVELIGDVRGQTQLVEQQKAAMRIADAEEGRQQAEAANSAKSEFLANISHELRTPLHGILSMARFGVDKHGTAPPDRILKYFTRIVESGDTLLLLVDDLLDLAKLDRRAPLNLRRVEFAPLVESIVDEFASIVVERRIALTLHRDGGGGPIRVDADKIRQVIRNVLANAVKFSDDGASIELVVSVSDDQAFIEVRDHGPGIPEAELETVFDRFAQSSRTKTGAGGTGLGLAICREIVGAHNGRIWAENHPEGGSIFRIEVPVGAVQAAQDARAERASVDS